MGDLLPPDRVLEGEVEVIERLDLGKARPLDAGLAAVGLTPADILGQHRGEIGLVVPRLGARPLGEHAPGLGEARRLEGACQGGDLGCRPAHDSAPTSAS